MNRLPRLARRLLRLALLGLPAAALAGDPAVPATTAYTWRNVVIKGGGFVTGLLYHPAERGLLYARTDVGGAFRWDAAARRWVALNDNLGPDDAQLLGVLSFAVDARDPRRLYLACGSYLFAQAQPAALLSSPDRGATWTRTPLPFHLGGNWDGREAGERLQVDPHDGAVLLLGTNQDGLWRSGDGGNDWRRIAGFPRAGLTFVLFDPAGGADGQATRVVYAGAVDRSGPALYRSTDAGTTWKAVAGQPAGFLIQHAALDSAGALYLTFANNPGPNDTSDGAVWKYQPAGERWTDLTPVKPAARNRDGFSYAGLAVDARHGGTVLVSTLDRWTHGDEIFRSTDGGASWKPLLAASSWDNSSAPYTRAFQPHWIGAIALDPFEAEGAFFTTGYGVFATSQADATDRGAATPWIFADDGLEEIVAADLVSPPEGAPLLSALFDVGGFRHDDLAASPAAGTLQPERGSSPSIAFASGRPARLVRTHSGAAGGAFSTDGGVHWTDFPTAPPPARSKGPGKIAISADGKHLVWMPKGTAPFFSDDGGATWTPSRAAFTSPGDFHSVGAVADGVNSSKFYFYDPATGRFYASTDDGRTFSRTARLPAGGASVRAMPGVDGSVWVPTPKGLFVSGDSGRTFHKAAAVEQADQVGFGCAAPGRTGPAVFLAGRIGGIRGVFRSDDGGAGWTRVNASSLQFGWINAITGDPRVFGRVYVGTGGRGIFCGELAPR